MAISPENQQNHLAVAEAERIMKLHKKSRILRFLQSHSAEVTYVSALTFGASTAAIITSLIQDVHYTVLSQMTSRADIILNFKEPSIGLAGFGGVMVADILYRHLLKR